MYHLISVALERFLALCIVWASLVLEKISLLDSMKTFVVVPHVIALRNFTTECFLTMILRNDNALEMVGFNVSPNDIALSLFSKHLAFVSFLASINIHIFTTLHQRPHLYIGL